MEHFHVEIIIRLYWKIFIGCKGNLILSILLTQSFTFNQILKDKITAYLLKKIYLKIFVVIEKKSPFMIFFKILKFVLIDNDNEAFFSFVGI